MAQNSDLKMTNNYRFNNIMKKGESQSVSHSMTSSAEQSSLGPKLFTSLTEILEILTEKYSYLTEY